MVTSKIDFVNKSLKWGYLADISGQYRRVFEPYLTEWVLSDKKKWPKIQIIEALNRDIRALDNPKWPEFIEEFKKLNVHLTAHDSFLRNDFYDPKTDRSIITGAEFFSHPDFKAKGNITNFFWYVVPSSYAGPFPAHEKTVEDGMANIDFAARYGADRLTVHATKPELRFTEEEFQKYVEKWKKLHSYGLEKNVKVLVETGGLTEEQLLNLRDRGSYFNLDTAHAFLDGLDVTKIYALLGSQIKEIHLSMIKYGKDFHAGLNYIDDGYSPELRKINVSMARKVSENQLRGGDITLILETSPSKGDLDFLHAALRGELDG